jgi:hypothetical protein
MEKGVKNNSTGSTIDLVLDDLMKKSGRDITYNREYQINKPSIYNVWMIADKKTTQSDSYLIIKKLSDNNFIKISEIEKLSTELMSSLKLRVAVLPKNCVDSILNDLKSWFNISEVEFVLNEFCE